MTTIHQRRRRALRAVAPVAGLLAAGLLVWQGSYAAFSATTDNNGNAWTSGNVVLKNDGVGGTYAVSTPAAFSETGLKPGSTGSKCIVVESSGSLASSVKLYAASVSNNALASNMTLTVDLDTTGAKTNCAGFTVGSTPYSGSLAGLSANSSFATGLGTWNPVAAPPNRYATYRFTWTVNAGAPSAAMGLTANANFVWEAQNT